jgi:DHA1 family purine base/nucleoside efflux pump-like MFS transporter
MVRGSLTVFTAAYVALGVLGGLAHSPLTIILAGLTTTAWGLSSWAFVPPQQAQLIGAAPDESAVALSFNIFALEAGIAIGSGLGGVILSDKHTDTLPYAGAILTFVALLAAITVERRARDRHPNPREPDVVAEEAS